MADRPVAIELLRPFAARLRAMGVDPGPIAVRAGVLARRGDRAEPTLRHPVARAFCELAAEAAGDRWLGAHVAEERPRGSFGVVEFGVRAAPDVGAALAFLVRFAPLLRDGTVTYDDRDRRELRVGFAVPGDPEGLGRQAHAFKLVSIAALLREISGDDAIVARAWTSDDAPENVGGGDEPLRVALGAARLEHGRRDCGLAIASSSLERAIRAADAPLFAYLERQATATLAEMRETVVPTYVRARLRELLLRGEPGLAGLARSLRMSPRTLQRRFQDAGSSYHAFLDETRRELALRELEQSEVEVSELATRLGFSGAASFIRAFHRWTGTTPTRWRRRLTKL